MAKNQRNAIFALVVVVTGFVLLLLRAPEIPQRWWGWLVAFVLPVPSAIWLADYKPESPKLPLLTQSHFRKQQQLAIGGFKLVLFGHFMFTLLVWLVAGKWVYVQSPL